MRGRDQRRAVAACLAALWAAAGCRSVTDPPLPAGAVRVAPPAVYARWWAMTQACSGHTRSFGDISWYVVPNAASFRVSSDKEANGYYLSAGAQIVLAGQVQLDGAVVRHEMLHALLKAESGHSRAEFLDRCAGVVVCAAACVRDAGPAPAPASGSRTVAATALVVDAALSTAAPSASQDDGWFTVTVAATNAAATPVVVVFPPARGNTGFSYQVAPDPPRPPLDGEIAIAAVDEPVWDASTLQFAAGETKRFVFDARVVRPGSGDAGLAPGRYTLRGGFGGDPGARSSTLTVTLSP